MHNKLAPIVLFVYKRLDHTKIVIEALRNNPLADQSVLYIYSDGAKNEEDKPFVQEVRDYVNSVSGFADVEVICSPINLGIEKSEIKAITEIVEKYGKIIVLEDDVKVNKGFLEYMNKALAKYENEQQIYSVVGFSFQNQLPCKANFAKLTGVWGWGTWKRAWDRFEHNPVDWLELLKDEKLKREFNYDNANPWFEMMKAQYESNEHLTWDIRWYWTVFKNNGLVLWPSTPLALNVGFDGTGVHCPKENRRLEFAEDNITVKSLPNLIKEKKVNRFKMRWAIHEFVYKENFWGAVKRKLLSRFKRN